MSGRDTLQPRALARIRDLRLLARLVVEGSLHGLHRSRQLGAGMEFNQYRQYEPGDDPRQIDWRLYARSDKVFVRQSERESHVAVWLVVDTSASMQQPSSDIESWTRLDYARAVAASLAWLSRQQGDGFGLIGLSDHGPDFLPLGADEQHLDRMLLALQRLQAQGQWPGADQLDTVWQQMASPGLVVLISDFFQREGEIETLIAKLQAGGKEVLTLQLLTQDEQDFSYRGNVEFVDRETGKIVQADAQAIRDDYLTSFGQAKSALARRLAGMGVEHFCATIEQPVDDVLWRFLQARARVAPLTRQQAG